MSSSFAGVSVGDRVNMDATEVRVNNGVITETPVVHTFIVESVDLLGGHWWCKGPIVESTGKPFTLGGVKYLGEARD